MRFIGNKENLLDKIHKVTVGLGTDKGSFCDFFSGTSNVGRFFKEKGFSILSSDLLYFSYVLQKAYIENNEDVTFKKLLTEIRPLISNETLFSSPLEVVLNYLNWIKPVEGFIYRNYTLEGTADAEHQRMYFTGINGMKIDAIRQQIENWYDHNLIKENEYFILIASLIESVPFYANISGVYAAFLKKYDPRAIKDLKVRPIKLYTGKTEHSVFNKNSMDLIPEIDVDILYLDPPYNARQYAPNYHLLETIARYDEPKIKGVTGMRDYTEQKSDFCNPEKALVALDKIASGSKYGHLLLSYNSEGIMPQKEILKVLNKYGDVNINEIDYPRFRSHSNGDSATKHRVLEQIYTLSR